MATTSPPKAPESYLRLAALWPPHVIHDDEDYANAAEVARAVSARAEEGTALDEGESMYLEAVLAMLEAYDAKHPALPAEDLPLPDRLRGLMDVSGLSQSDLAEIAGISRGNVSDVMAGRRGLSKDAIRRLSQRFRIGAEFFL